MNYRVPKEAHHELVNWSRWCWIGEAPQPGHGEPGWLGGPPIPTGGDDDEVRPGPPCAERARIVQATWERMHEQARLVLRAEYPARTGQGRAYEAQRLRLSLHQYEAALEWAVHKVEEAFDALCA